MEKRNPFDDDDVRNGHFKSEINIDNNFGNNHTSDVVNVAELGKTDPFDFDVNENTVDESPTRLSKRKDEPEFRNVRNGDVFIGEEDYLCESIDEFYVYEDDDVLSYIEH